MLSIMASFAQEESRGISENVRWGIKKRFEKGLPNGRVPVFGYDWVGDELIINETEGPIIKQMFKDYSEGMALKDILKWMNQTGLKTRKGNKFSHCGVNAMLINPTYTGVLLLCKEYVGDPILHDRHINHGELPQYLVENHHEPLVDDETWRRVQERKEKNRRPQKANRTIHSFTGKLKCKECGRNYQRIDHRNGRVKWKCYSRTYHLEPCESQDLDDAQLKEICCEILRMRKFDTDHFRQQVEQIEVSEDGTLEFKMTDGRRTPCKYEKSQ